MRTALILAQARDVPSTWLRTGLVLVVGRTALLLGCVRDFHTLRSGTLAPWWPPQRLVTVGPRRYSRNPMHGAVIAVLAGGCVRYRADALLIYALVVGVAFYLRILITRNPDSKRPFGLDWIDQGRRVRRWL